MAKKRRPADMREKILSAAETLIIEQGYRGTSLDAVVEKAGCSKTAVYDYFGGKEGLLSALSVEVVGTLSSELDAISHSSEDISSTLEAYAAKAMGLILSERHMSIVRSLIAEVWHAPNLGHSYYRLGPRLAQERLAEYLEKQNEAGRLDTPDAAAAATHFFGLMLWDKWNAMVVGAKPALTRNEIGEEARIVVAAFMRLYGKS